MVINDGLVSIIVPCYNMERYIERFLKSVLEQTYRKIEVIIVDDGSTDGTAANIAELTPVFEKEGIQIKYIHQENSGLGATINTGLKHVKGEFLCWADPDDYYLPDSVKLRVDFLKSHSDYAVVNSDAYVYRSSDLINPIKKEASRFFHRYEDYQFEYLLAGESHLCAGCHMIRMHAFDEVNPKRDIYPAKRGQNYQLLLPVYFRFKAFFLDEPLYCYIIYPDSMSTGDNTKEKEMMRWNEHQNIILETLKRIPMNSCDQEKYVELVNVRYAKQRFYTAIDHRDKSLIKEQYEILKKCNADTEEVKELYLRNYYMIFKLYFKIKEVFKK